MKGDVLKAYAHEYGTVEIIDPGPVPAERRAGLQAERVRVGQEIARDYIAAVREGARPATPRMEAWLIKNLPGYLGNGKFAE